jgi:HSP20 family protein
MNNLVPRDNFFQHLFDFRRDFDQIFNRMLSGSPFFGEDRTTQTTNVLAPAVQAYVDKDGKTYHCRVSLPGVDPKDVQIHAQGNTLAISGERKVSQMAKDVDYLQNEIWYGTFERVLTLPEGVDVDKLNAEYHNGLLEITAPVAASALPRRIEIKTTPLSKQMTA